jgi:ribonuclease HI
MKTPLNIVLWFALCSGGFGCVILMWYECGFSLPTCMTHHGLRPANVWQIQFWATFSTTTWDAPAWAGGSPPAGIQFLFIDGSCSDPSHKFQAVGGWSVVSANIGQVVGAGLLPTIFHDSDRCEVWACAMALQWLIYWGCHAAVLHTDSQYILEGCVILQQCLTIPADWCNKNLREYVLQGLLRYTGTLHLKKVGAHQVLHDAQSDEEAFCTRWNSVADTPAKTARVTGMSMNQADI